MRKEIFQHNKKNFVLMFTILLMIFPLVSAIDFEMNSNLSKGEMLIAKISGNFVDQILEENILFYRRHLPTSFEDVSVLKINSNEFYVSAKVPLEKIPDNYSVAIKDVEYYIAGGETSTEDITQNFSIQDKIADFSIDKGAIITEEDFSMQVQNLQDSKITIKIKIETETSIELFAGETKDINFQLKDLLNSTWNIIELSTENLIYEIPVYVLKTQEQEVELQESFSFELSNVNVSLSTNSSTTKIIYLENTGEVTLENINLSLSENLEQYISLSILEIDELEPGIFQKIELEVLSFEEELVLEGELKAQTENLSDSLIIYLNFIQDYVPLEEDEEEEIATSKTCLELGGKFCTDKEECSEETENADDGLCCLAECNEVEKSSSGKIVGWLIVAAILIFVIWFFKAKYKGAKTEINLLKIAKGKK